MFLLSIFNITHRTAQSALSSALQKRIKNNSDLGWVLFNGPECEILKVSLAHYDICKVYQSIVPAGVPLVTTPL
jgi:hypothetical protein